MALTFTRGTTITFVASGGDVAMTLTSLGDDAGRHSAAHDTGASARTPHFEVTAKFQHVATPTVGEQVLVYMQQADSDAVADWQNDDGTGDIALSAQDKLKNMALIGSATIDEAAASIEVTMDPVVIDIHKRYVRFCVWNEAGSALSAVAAENYIELTPIDIDDT